MFENINKFLY